uniref:Uncharacterized protein n=1 Tax=Rhizophora mucronata TaxID=61149 RepID=A0A2P2IV80_RHIMU
MNISITFLLKPFSFKRPFLCDQAFNTSTIIFSLISGMQAVVCVPSIMLIVVFCSNHSVFSLKSTGPLCSLVCGPVALVLCLF